MSFNPYQSIGTGVSDSSLINGPIAGLNTILAGFTQSAVASCTVALTVGTSYADVSGCSVTVTPTGNNSLAVVLATFDVMNTVTTSNQVFAGTLVVDSTAQTDEAHCDDRVSRVTCGQTYVVSLPAGSHTLKLQAKKAQAGGTFQVQTQHTTITVVLIDIP